MTKRTAVARFRPMPVQGGRSTMLPSCSEGRETATSSTPSLDHACHPAAEPSTDPLLLPDQQAGCKKRYLSYPFDTKPPHIGTIARDEPQERSLTMRTPRRSGKQAREHHFFESFKSVSFNKELRKRGIKPWRISPVRPWRPRPECRRFSAKRYSILEQSRAVHAETHQLRHSSGRHSLRNNGTLSYHQGSKLGSASINNRRNRNNGTTVSRPTNRHATMRS